MASNKKDKTRILIGLSEVAGYHQNLKKGFLELGHKCYFISRNVNHFNHGGDNNNLLIRVWRYLFIKHHNSRQRVIFTRIFWYALYQASNLAVFVWALFSFDVFIFGFAATFYNYKELPLLRFFGKKVIYIFHGTDSRAPYLNAVYNERGTKETVRATRRIKEKLLKIEKYANYIISNPSQGHLHERVFINRDYISSPVSCKDCSVSGTKDEKRPLTIVHSPSNKSAKGTSEIRKIITRLRKKGYDFEYIEITNVSNKKVLESMSRADIVIDQLYSDNLLTSISLESACFGKPSIMGGYYSDLIGETYDGKIPFVFCSPEKFEESLAKLIADKKSRIKIGEEARKFVTAYCSPKKVAENYLILINDNVPQKWFFNPQETSYIYGCGLNKKEVAKNIKKIIEESGTEALELEDKKELQNKFKKLAKNPHWAIIIK